MLYPSYVGWSDSNKCHTPKEQTHLYCKYRINILQTGNQFRLLVKRVPICLIARKQQPGFECDLWPFARSSLALHPVYSALMNFEYRLKKIEERNAANTNPSRPDRRLQISVSFMLLGRTGQSGLLWNVSNHKQLNYQINWATWLNQLCTCVSARPSHIHMYTVKCDWHVSHSLTWLTSTATGPNLEINTFLFLFLSAQWLALSPNSTKGSLVVIYQLASSIC